MESYIFDNCGLVLVLICNLTVCLIICILLSMARGRAPPLTNGLPSEPKLIYIARLYAANRRYDI